MADEAQTYADDGSGSGFSAHDAAAELSQRRAKSPEVVEVGFRDGRSAPESLTPQDAGKELEKYRVLSEQVDDRPIEEIKYQDDPKYDLRTTRQAAKDLADYRATLAAQLDGQTLADIAQAAPEPTGEQQTQPEQARQEPPVFTTDLLAQAEELLQSESPQDRAAAKELVTKAVLQSAVERQQTAEVVRNLQHQTGQAYGQVVGELQSMVGSAMLAEYGSVDPAELAQRDPAAFARLQRMGQVYNTLNQQSQAQQRATLELQSREFNSWAQEQDKLASKAIPESADPAFQALVPQTMINDWGFQPAELAAAYQGHGLSLRDSRVQRVIADAVRFRQASKAASQPVRKPLPPVQRPGTSQPYAPAERHDLRGMEGRLSRSGNLKDAASLLIARRTRS